jgi:beta-lactamase class A
MCLLLLSSPALAAADEIHPGPDFEVRPETLLRELERSPRDGTELAPLWRHEDPALEAEVERELERLGLAPAVKKRRLSVVLIDITDLERPRVADLNGDLMMYAASLPKIAVLLAAFEEIDRGHLVLDAETEDLMKRMIRRSSNSASTELMHRVGKENIARLLLSPRYRLYDPQRGGGLWVGKDYAKAGLWRRDPLNNLSHGATAMEVARFYYMLEAGDLVSPEASAKMREILSGTELDHKFAKALRSIDPQAEVLRKSGSWRSYHSDSALVRRRGRRYIAVALCNDPEGASWLVRIARALDAIIFRESSTRMPLDPDRRSARTPAPGEASE